MIENWILAIRLMKYIPIILLVVLFLACGNGKGGKNNEPYDGGHGIGIDTATIHQIDLMEDSVPVTKEIKDSHTPPPPPPDGKHFDGPPPHDKHLDGPPPPPPGGKRFNGPPPPPPHEKGRPPHEPDNMRGFDPASEDDMDDNGMSRYMENNDEEGWD